MSDLNLKSKDKQEIKEPPMYKVVFYNDDYTPFDFVAAVLQKVFKKTTSEAFAFADQVHTKGKGIAGTFSHDIANTKSAQVNALAKQNQYPLKTTIEEA